jgi:hypothetical protein
MTISITPFIYLFDNQHNLLKTKKLKIIRENLYHDDRKRKLMYSLILEETTLENAEFWLIDIMVKIGSIKYFYPLFFSVLSKNEKNKCIDYLDGYLKFEINQNILKNPSVDFEFSKITDIIPHYYFNSKQTSSKILSLYKKYRGLHF